MQDAILSRCRARRIAIAASLVLAGLGAPAQAALGEAPAEGDANPGCTVQAFPLMPALDSPTTVSKAAAVLGGAPSALDAIRAQQGAVAPRTSSNILAAAAVGALLTPGIDASKPMRAACGSLAASRPASVPGSLTPFLGQRANPEDFLASKRVQIGRTHFDKDWQRVRGEKLSARVARRHLGALTESREQSLAAVNRWANQRIRYTEDRDQYGMSDFWAGARKTLKAGKGDCEDIALVKLQLLAAVGVPSEDMILTIARDLVRNADHAVLIVRTDAGWRMLDNATDEVLDAVPSHDYRAILSFGSQGSWLHGV